MDSAALRCFAGLACVRFNYGYGMLVTEGHGVDNPSAYEFLGVYSGLSSF
jgi:hypothetical protein